MFYNEFTVRHAVEKQSPSGWVEPKSEAQAELGFHLLKVTWYTVDQV